MKNLQSLPMWERGLKSEFKILDAYLARMSLPMWERGLKLNIAGLDTEEALSLPMWERGLKYVFVLS